MDTVRGTGSGDGSGFGSGSGVGAGAGVGFGGENGSGSGAGDSYGESYDGSGFGAGAGAGAGDDDGAGDSYGESYDGSGFGAPAGAGCYGYVATDLLISGTYGDEAGRACSVGCDAIEISGHFVHYNMIHRIIAEHDGTPDSAAARRHEFLRSRAAWVAWAARTDIAVSANWAATYRMIADFTIRVLSQSDQRQDRCADAGG